ncbi:hypothetical protein AVEN_189612-1 [Araneus ventricosus]|uniref:HTH CENPB-type domain-containing protein n=1 Tax=Araneus ventricosus TaxID=182803 RepID=A0A4Y2QX01_ARAVE|nr:hypothetical protein AVEN_189612-1 [Araneus ventricosus]
MIRSYQRKTDRSNLSEDIIEKAVKDVILNNKSIREAAKHYNLTKSMLHKRVNIAKSQCKELNSECNAEEIDVKTTKVIGRNKYRCHQVLADEEEQLLSEYFLMSSKIHYGLTFLQARALAFQYAEKLGKAMPSSWNVNECAGIDWMQSFMKRHPRLSLRKPENTSLSRATSFNKKNVGEFFDNLYAVMEKYKFKPERILNFDETGITTVLQSPEVIAQTGKKQVRQAVSGERGELVSFCGIISATGNSIPPFFIFPRVKYKDYFLCDAPTGSLAITYAKENDIVLLSFPPHCSHRLQPLDVAVYGAFKGACKVSFNDWLLNHPAFGEDDFFCSYITDHEYPGCNTTETKDCTVINEDLQENELQDEDHTEPLQPTTPESVRPYSKAVFKKKKNLRKKAKSTVYISTPEKRRIEDMEKNKLIEAKKGERKKRKILCSKKESEILTKKDVCISSDSESDISKQEDRASELEETRILKPIDDTDLIGINDFVLVKFL